MNEKRTKKAIIRALENEDEDEENSKCCLVIIPFQSKKVVDKRPELKKYARDVLEVDDNFYKEILKDYEDYKLDKENKK